MDARKVILRRTQAGEQAGRCVRGYATVRDVEKAARFFASASYLAQVAKGMNVPPVRVAGHGQPGTVRAFHSAVWQAAYGVEIVEVWR